MKLELVTPTGIKRSEDIYEVTLPTQDGEIGVLPGHEPLVTLLEAGLMMVRYKKSDKEMEPLAVSRGIAEITGDTVRILADEAEDSTDIVEAEVKAALARAEKMRAEAKNQVELNEAMALLRRQGARLKVAELKRRTHRERKSL